MSPWPILFLFCLLIFCFLIFYSSDAAGPRERETVKKRIKTVLDYLETVQEFVNLDGYLALGFTQSRLRKYRDIN
jgi:hypothetical protein